MPRNGRKFRKRFEQVSGTGPHTYRKPKGRATAAAEEIGTISTSPTDDRTRTPARTLQLLGYWSHTGRRAWKPARRRWAAGRPRESRVAPDAGRENYRQVAGGMTGLAWAFIRTDPDHRAAPARRRVAFHRPWRTDHRPGRPRPALDHAGWATEPDIRW